LVEWLFATAANFAAGLGRVGAEAGVRAVRDDDFLHGLQALGAFKGRKIELLFGALRGIGCENGKFHG
jgi:hypothetical protein